MKHSGKNPRSHRIAKGADAFCGIVRSLLEVSDCDIGRIVGSTSVLRGVRLLKRNFDIEARIYCDGGVQYFYIKPSNGYTLSEVMESVHENVSKRYEIIEKEVSKMAGKRTVTTPEMMDEAFQVLWIRADVGDDEERRLSGVFSILVEHFQERRIANAILTNLKTSRRIIADGSFKPEKGKAKVIYRVVAYPKVEKLLEEVPGSVLIEAEQTSPEAELLSSITDNKELALEAFKSLIVLDQEKLDNLIREMNALEQKRVLIDVQIKENTQNRENVSVKLMRLERLVELLSRTEGV